MEPKRRLRSKSVNLRTGEVSYEDVIVRTTGDYINSEHARAIRTPLPPDETTNVVPTTRSVAGQTDFVSLAATPRRGSHPFRCNWLCV